jgi:hypothetical protein
MELAADGSLVVITPTGSEAGAAIPGLKCACFSELISTGMQGVRQLQWVPSSPRFGDKGRRGGAGTADSQPILPDQASVAHLLLHPSLWCSEIENNMIPSPMVG